MTKYREVNLDKYDGTVCPICGGTSVFIVNDDPLEVRIECDECGGIWKECYERTAVYILEK